MTFGEMKALIADDIARSDLTTQIAQAVLDAIQDQERTRFYFNERRDAPAFTTVAGQEFYTSADDADIATIAHIDDLALIYNSGRRLLTSQTERWMEDQPSNTGFQGVPSDYSYLAKRIRLYPIPDAAYDVYMTGQIRLAALSAAGDTNVWTEDANQLIRFAAKEKLYRHVIQDPQRADQMGAAAAMQRSMLLGESMKRGGQHRLKSTPF